MKTEKKHFFAKVASFCLCGALLIGSVGLVGCGQKRDPNKVYISRWALEWEKPLFEAWTDKFEEENPGIEVEWDFNPYTAHFDKLRTDLLSGEAADIIFVNNWGWEPYSKIDVFEDLGAVESLSATRSGILDSAQDAFRQGDKIVGIPVGLVSRVPVVGTKDFENAGIDIPYDRETAFTGEELANLVGDVADSVNKPMGINITLTDALLTFLASVDAPLIKDGEIMCNTPAGVKAVQEFYDFATSGRVVPLSQSYGGMYGTADNAVMSGTCVAGYTNPGGLKSLLDSGWDIATIPTVKAEGGKDVVVADFNALVVPKFSKVKEKAYKVIEYMLSQQAQLEYAVFSDLPVNKLAFNEVMNDSENWDPTLYSAYGVGIDNLYVPPALSTDFQTFLGGCLKNLLDGAISAEQFCLKMEQEGKNYI